MPDQQVDAPIVETAQLQALWGGGRDDFGAAVALNGQVVVVGAPWRDGPSQDVGSAFVFVRQGPAWSTMTENAELSASERFDGDDFGRSVAIDGNTIVVGAPGGNGAVADSGVAYVFVRPAGGWATRTETAMLVASDGAPNDHLGVSVAIYRDTVVDFVVVGASGGGANGQGAAYVFVRPPGGWASGTRVVTETAKLTASDGARFDRFGCAVAICGDTVVIGARLHGIGGNARAGSAYVFVRPAAGGWSTATETAKLTASDGGDEHLFGNSVSIDGTTVVIGAPQDYDPPFGPGAAYVFERPAAGWSTMTETARLAASDAANGDAFGKSVAVAGDVLVVGAARRNAPIQGCGAAYVFVEPAAGWSVAETEKLLATDPSFDAGFGSACAIDGDTVVIGARQAAGNTPLTGKAYVFSIASFSSYGSGCNGLSLTLDARPVLGTRPAFEVTGHPLPEAGIGAALLGALRHDPGLPLDESGAPGCAQYASTDVVWPFTVTNHAATVPLPGAIPSDPQLIGARVHGQAATLAATVNPLGLVTSNGVGLILALQ